MIMLHHI